jgi:hypothetical protein
MAGAGTRWFVVASPTGSTESEFFSDAGTDDINQSGSRYINLGAIVGSGTPFLDWGTAGTFPTYSAYSPGIYIRDYINSPYTSSIYTYIDSDESTPVTSIQQDLQKIFFPGIVTGSSAFGFGGKVLITGSTADQATFPISSNAAGSIGFTGTANPVTFANTVTMSFAPVSFNSVNFAGFITTSIDTDYQLIYRDFASNAQAVYNVSGPVTSSFTSLGAFRGYYIPVSYVSSNGTLILSNSGSVTFIDTTGNQSTFYVVGVANPAAGLPFAGQSTVGTVGAGGDLRSGIIKVYATESNNTSDWTRLIRVVTGDNTSNYTNPSYVAFNHNLIMFTASAGSAGTGSWDLLYTPPA